MDIVSSPHSKMGSLLFHIGDLFHRTSVLPGSPDHPKM